MPGPRAANDYPYVYQEQLRESLDSPATWSARGSEGMGEVSLLTMWGWPVDIVFGIGANLGFSFAFLERVLGLLVIFLLGIHSISRFLKDIDLKRASLFVASLFYLTTTYLILLIDGGQIQIALAYAFFPLAFVLLKEAVSGGFKEKLKASIGVVFMSFLDIRFVYILLLLSLFWFIFDFFFLLKNKTIFIKNLLKTGIIILIVYVGINFFWIFPIIYTSTDSVSTSFSRLTDTNFLTFSTWKHALLLHQPHWYKNLFGKVEAINKEFLLIPLIAFIAPILVFAGAAKDKERRLKVVFFWVFNAIVGVFLVKGANPPLQNIYPWLFTNIPGFSLFRDSTKFFFLVALSYSALIGFTVDALTKRFDWKLSFKEESLLGKMLGNKIEFIPLLLTTYFMLLVYPVWAGKLTGILSEPVYQEEYSSVAAKLEGDKAFGRVFWIPSRPPLGFSSSTHRIVEALRLVNLRPFTSGIVGTYEIFNYLREASFMGELFDIAAIKYIAYPYPDVRREELKEDNIEYYYAFLDQLSNVPWVESRITEPPVTVLKVKENQEHLFTAENTFTVVGNDRIYKELLNIPGFKLKNNALTFAEESPGIALNTFNDSSSKIILYGRSNNDVVLSMVSPEYFIFPANQLDFEPDETGFWKRETSDFLWWRNFLQTKYRLDFQDFDFGGGYAVAEGKRELGVENLEFGKEKLLFVRAMVGPRGGKIEFWQGEEKIGEIDTLVETPEKINIKLAGYKEIPDQIFEYDKAELKWHSIGKLINGSPLIIKTEGDVNVINTFVSISGEEYVSIEERMAGGNVVIWDELSTNQKEELFKADTKAGLTYKRISPTKYTVNVEGVTKPVSLIFSETHDPLWKVKHPDGKVSSANKVYSLVNGFIISSDGEYVIYFEPQKYVYPGLVVSGVMLASMFTLLVLLRKREKKQV